MRRFLLSLIAVTFTAGFAAPAQAQIEKYSFDKAHTQILFFVNHLGFSNSHGEFLDFDGTLTLNRGELAKSGVDVTIQTASIDMNDEKWDTHMKNEDFFHVEKFPTMTFKSTDVEVTGENTANVTGDLTILETTRPVVLAVTHNKSGKHPMGEKYQAGFSATVAIKRSDFGMTYGLPMVGDDIQIRIEVEAVRQELGGEGQGNK
ncbi:MAG: polyisoprenoid-binding protein [Micavibrio sp.]|nr:MAG: polyisoprenoid-binding protein [Micavibrio sp.]